MATTTKTKHTYADYARLPEGTRVQLIGGELVNTPAPNIRHQSVQAVLGNAFFNFVTERNLGKVFFAPTDVYFTEEETYQPDIIFISRERLHIIGEQKIEGAPDLVVEILSESSAYYDLKHKRRVYEKFGVKEYWIVDPMEDSIEVYALREGKFKPVGQAIKSGSVASELLKGFSVNIEKIFS
ncbi:MAG: Uma2 family endonuclease [Calditrichaeota bacterium]|nr:MAG: Uma2 family endonuclease [Calditrichota bacterium]